MSAVEIANRRENLAKLTGDGSLSSTGITCQNDVHRHLLLLAQSALGTLHAVLHSIGDLTHGTLHLVHTDILVEILENILHRTLLRNISLDIALLNDSGRSTSADKLGKDILGSLHCQVGIAESLVLDLDLILEVTLQLVVGLWGEVGDAIAGTEAQFTDVCQLSEVWCRQTEGILETVSHSGIALQEIIETLGESGNDHHRIVIPLIHLDKELVERIHLIGILVRQEFLNIVKEQNTVLRLLDVIVPLVDKALIVDSIDHGQLWLVYNLILIEIITEDFGQGSLASTRLADDDGIDGYTHLCNILAGTQEGVGVNDGLQLLLDTIQTYQLVEQVLAYQRLSAPLAKLGNAPVFLMTMFANHYSTSFSNC